MIFFFSESYFPFPTTCVSVRMMGGRREQGRGEARSRRALPWRLLREMAGGALRWTVWTCSLSTSVVVGGVATTYMSLGLRGWGIGEGVSVPVRAACARRGDDGRWGDSQCVRGLVGWAKTTSSKNFFCQIPGRAMAQVCPYGAPPLRMGPWAAVRAEASGGTIRPARRL